MSSERLLLRAQNISKTYPSPLAPTDRLKQALFGVAPPTAGSHTVLSGINLDVLRGDIVGIIGRNGAGKSTLLGILGNVIEATTGTVERYGKVAVLLEIGAGFHPNFTGRENANLFCSIMGMTRAETAERVPLIEAFADIGDYFDLPLRTYSSGMHARVGFACAVHVNADLIIVDETLAVGDAIFRMKCYRLIEEMKAQGQTFLIVSHNQNVVANFCTRAIVIEKGIKLFDGTTREALKVYKDVQLTLEQGKGDSSTRARDTRSKNDIGSGHLSLENITFSEATRPGGTHMGIIRADLVAHCSVRRPNISFGIRNGEGVSLCAYNTARSGPELPPLEAGGRTSLVLTFVNRLLPAAYYLSLTVTETVGEDQAVCNHYPDGLRFDVLRTAPNQGIIDLEMQVNVEESPAILAEQA